MAVQAAEAEARVDNNMTIKQRRGTMRGRGITRGGGQGTRETQQEEEGGGTSTRGIPCKVEAR
jgi:hypothetical protein